MDFHTRYKFNPKTDLLGKGGFSRVYKANDILLERTVALKFFTSNASEKYQVLTEIKKVIRFEHPNLCKYYDVVVLDGTNILGEIEKTEIGIMEYLDEGDFKTFLNLHPEHTDKLLLDVLKGLSYLHKKGIVHRDLKPQNILVTMVDDEPVAKITDFGISKLISSEDQHSTTLMGTIEYMAPEQFNPAKYGAGGRITTNLDLWSFGLLVCEALHHKAPFGSRRTGTSAEQVMRNILSDFSLESVSELPLKYRVVVERCLVKHASDRVQTASELIVLFSEEIKRAEQVTPGTQDALRDPLILENTSGRVITGPDNRSGQIRDPDIQTGNSIPGNPGEQDNDETKVLKSGNIEVGTDQDETKVLKSGNIDNKIPFLQGGARWNEEKQGGGEIHSDETKILQSGNIDAYPDGDETKFMPADFKSYDTTKVIQPPAGITNDKNTPGRNAAESYDEETQILNFSQPVTSQVIPGESVQPLVAPTYTAGTIAQKPLSANAATLQVSRALNMRRMLLIAAVLVAIIVAGIFWLRSPASKDVVAKKTNTAGKSVASTLPVVPLLPALVRIDPGSFYPKNAGDETAASHLNKSLITLGAFFIGKYEVSIGEFRKFINDARFITSAEQEGNSDIFNNGKWTTTPNINWRYDVNGVLLDTVVENIPVVHVSWKDANAYCEWLSVKNKKKYRLPSEAEWEYAARGGKLSKGYSFSGSNIIGDVAWFTGNSGGKVHPVGEKNPNELGIYDMTGNVMEWCNDWYADGYGDLGNVTNPPGPTSGNAKIVRGGSSFFKNGADLQFDFRDGFPPETHGGQIGFRICEVL